MGYRDNTESGRSKLFNTANPLVMLVVLQITFFILMNFLKSIYVFSRIPEEQFYRNIYHWFVMPADPMQFITRPWTLITMQFTEVKVILVISNLIWLWTFISTVLPSQVLYSWEPPIFFIQAQRNPYFSVVLCLASLDWQRLQQRFHRNTGSSP